MKQCQGINAQNDIVNSVSVSNWYISKGVKVTLEFWTVPKYRFNSVYKSSYKRHRTVQYETHSQQTRSSAVRSKTQSRAQAQHSRSRHARRIAHRSVTTSCTYVSAINTTNFIQCNRCVQT